MAIASPNENVYYYECNNGQFRLFYFIPPGELKRLCNENRISEKVLKDYPDGVDLGCTEANFMEFENAYDCSIPLDPNAMCRAFFAILSTTRNWKKFRGSGLIPAGDLERHVEKVDQALRRKKVIQKYIKPLQAEMPLKKLRQRKRRKGILQKQTEEVLRKLRVKGIKSNRNMAQQKFSAINMAEGTGAEEVFVRLHHKKRKE